MFGFSSGFSGSADRFDRMALFPVRYPKTAADGHLGMTALSRVILASAGLSRITDN